MVKRAVTLAVAMGGMILIPAPAPALAQLSPTATPSAAALSDIPPYYLTLYIGAARTCPGLPWQVLAAIGSIESDNGQSGAPGVHGPTGYADPEGPMQFEPSTFAEFAVRADRGVPVSPYDPADAIYSAARLLCAAGASGGSESGLFQAIYTYNHSGWYVTDVLDLAARYSGPAARRADPTQSARPAAHLTPAPALAPAPAPAKAPAKTAASRRSAGPARPSGLTRTSAGPARTSAPPARPTRPAAHSVAAHRTIGAP